MSFLGYIDEKLPNSVPTRLQPNKDMLNQQYKCDSET